MIDQVAYSSFFQMEDLSISGVILSTFLLADQFSIPAQVLDVILMQMLHLRASQL